VPADIFKQPLLPLAIHNCHTGNSGDFGAQVVSPTAQVGSVSDRDPALLKNVLSLKIETVSIKRVKGKQAGLPARRSIPSRIILVHHVFRVVFG
jgi:hypothetical protein